MFTCADRAARYGDLRRADARPRLLRAISRVEHDRRARVRPAFSTPHRKNPTMTIQQAPHPSLRVEAFTTTFPAPLAALTTPPELVRRLVDDPALAPPGLTRDEALRTAVRDMLRRGGYKPTGRGKPASEYLVRAAAEGALASINLAVDACNAVSLHTGFPISVVDLDRAAEPFRIAVAPHGATYVFNASGQTIDVGGLVCLFDGEGPCANAVKDAQRTKTGPASRRTLSVVWGVTGWEERLSGAAAWYRELLGRAGAETTPVC